MLTLRRILFPTDFSPCAERAFAHASFLAARHRAELHVLHVAPVTGRDARAHADPETVRYPEAIRRIDVTRRAVSAPREIVDYARTMDLVVMGTHGRRGVARVAVGSTTEQVMRAADCPVLAVGLDAERATPERLDDVLVPIDFSDSSGPSLAIADELASVYGARVTALHAVYVPDLPAIYGIGIHLDATYPDLVATTRDALAALVRQHVAPERQGDVVVRVGPPGPTILEEAETRAAGLLVMPTHGRTGLDRVAFGSVAEAVLRRAPCAVLALPSFGRLPLAEGSDIALPVARTALDREMAASLANHDV